MTILEFPAAKAHHTRQHGNIAAALIQAGIKPRMALAVSKSVMVRLAAHQGPDLAVNYRLGMPAADLAKQVHALAGALVAPLLLEIVKMEAELHRANEALAGVDAPRASAALKSYP
jgi:hypothetical protein